MDAQEQIERFQDFIDAHYKKRLHNIVAKGKKSLVIDFSELAKYDHDLAEQLLDDPEETIKAAELAIENFDLPKKVFRIRIRNLPKSQEMMVRNIRSGHINKLLSFEGIVRQSSDVRPQVVSAKFECPSCGNNISILQIDTKFKEPTRCSCGRRGRFRLLNKDLVDAQRLIVEESPETLEGGEQPKRLSVFLKEDLVEPVMEKKTTPGSKIKVMGIIKEVPIQLRTGAQSVRYDLIAEANFLEPIEQTFEDIEISKEEEDNIKALAKDPKVYEKLANSIAPSIYGHDEVKESLLLQLMGGVHKIKSEGTSTRGDIHCLLVGDPGTAKSTILSSISKVAPRSRLTSGKSATGAGLCVAPNSLVLTNPGGMENIQSVVEDRFSNKQEFIPGIWKQNNIEDVKIQSISHDLKLHSKNPKTIWKLEAPKKVFEITLSSGKKIELTGNTQLFTIKDGKTSWKKSMDIEESDYVATPRILIGGKNEKQYTVDLIKSNPVVHNIKPFVKELTKKLANKYGSLREVAKKLKINEGNLYYNWVNKKARGNIKLNNLRKVCEDLNVEWKEKVKTVSLYQGKRHTIPTYLNKDFLYLAGLIAGDGDIAKRGEIYSIRLSNSNKKLQSIFREIIRKEFNLKFDVRKGNNKRPEATRTSSKILAEVLLSLGIPISPKSDKIYLSNILLHLPNELLSEYIAGLYDSDGSVYLRKTRGSDGIELTTCSERLARQIQLILLRFNIYSKLRQKKPSKGKIMGKYSRWILEICGIEQIRKFVKEIKIRHPKKNKNLKEILSKEIRANTNIDIVPGISKRLKEILKEQEIPLGRMGSLRRIGWRENLSRQALQEIISKLNFENKELFEIKKIAYSDIFWEKVVSVNKKDAEYEYVYDLTVADSHNFVVDGVLVHNTAVVVRDEFLRGWALEAGAIVLANGGYLFVDELDKMSSEDRDALHEALEQQRISIAKANIQATLKAETTVLAAANPKLGRFDPYTPIAQQIDMPATLINRFDLIFIIRDLPSKESDEKIAKHVLSLHKKPEEIKPVVDADLFRKYISYAKQKAFPKLTDAAINEIKTFYVSLRNIGTTGDEAIRPIPISARQLEALVRLAESSARVQLRNKVNREDARRAIKTLKYCLMQVGIDPETGQIDIDIISTGIPATQRSRIVMIREIIDDLEKKVGASIPLEDVIAEAAARGIDEAHVEEVIERLRREGEIFQPRRDSIARVK